MQSRAGGRRLGPDAASARPGVLDGLAPYHTALDLPIARLLTDQDAASLPAAAIAAAP
jgi:hypothetical protein